MLKNCFDVVTIDALEPLKKIFDRCPAVEVFEKRCDREARSLE